jgi:hypothetical protein
VTSHLEYLEDMEAAISHIYQDDPPIYPANIIKNRLTENSI